MKAKKDAPTKKCCDKTKVESEESSEASDGFTDYRDMSDVDMEKDRQDMTRAEKKEQDRKRYGHMKGS